MGTEYDAFAEAAKLADQQVDTLRRAMKCIAEEAQQEAKDKDAEQRGQQR